MSHTPGPWTWLPDEGQFIVTDDRNIVAEIPCQCANAEDGPLIAAAPDLLKELQSMVNEYKPTWDDAETSTIKKARAAIAKALGK